MILAPSILSLHYDNFKDEIKLLNENVEYLHFDVMDGHFVPNLTFGPDILKAFRVSSSLFMDVHLMITNPKEMIDRFVNAGADNITFHLEAMSSLEETLDLINYIKSKYIKVGISIKPNTPVEILDELLDKIDMVLIMSVEPGFGGQKFIESSIEKIIYLNNFRLSHGLDFLIEVDGGINEMNAHSLKDFGADVLVAGSYVFKGDITNNIKTLQNV